MNATIRCLRCEEPMMAEEDRKLGICCTCRHLDEPPVIQGFVKLNATIEADIAEARKKVTA